MATIDYKEKYEQALEVAQRFYNNSVAITNKGLEDIFPELKESEDERIRKAIYNCVKWFGFDSCFFKDVSQEECLAWLEKKPSLLTKEKALKNSPFVEQKPADKKGMNLVEEEMTPFQKEVFCIIDTTIEEEQGLKQVCDKLFALASKEIKQKPVWSEEDKYYYGIIQYILNNECVGKADEENAINWFSSLKDRVQPQLKQEWSEEDESMLQNILECLKNGWKKLPTDILKYESWLKSLIPQNTWKPSDEQIMVLAKASEIYCGKDKSVLYSLYNDLKKLREE